MPEDTSTSKSGEEVKPATVAELPKLKSLVLKPLEAG
jgi:hypothetical protein